MEIDSMFFIRYQSAIKNPYLWGTKGYVGKWNFWREKNGEFHTLFPQLLEKTCKFYDYFRMLHETF